MKRIYAVLDIGSTTLKLLVAELMSTNINILFTKKLASHAIEGGLIKNEEVLVDEIRSIIKEADAELNTTITSVALVLPSNYARTYQTKGITKVNSPQDKIEVSDIVRVLKIAQRFEKSKKEEIVSTIPVTIRNAVSDIVYSPEKGYDDRVALILDDGKKLIVDIQGMKDTLSPSRFDYSAYMQSKSDVCVFSFEGRNLYMTKCE